MKNYRDLLTDSLSFVWQKKILIFLGLLATFTGIKQSFEMLKVATVNFGQFDPNISLNLQNFIAQFSEFWNNSKIVLKNDPLGFLEVSFPIAIIFIIFLLIFWISIISRIAIIEVITKRPKSSLKELTTSASQYFWRILSVDVLTILLLSIGTFIPALLSHQFITSHHLIYAIVSTLMLIIGSIFIFVIGFLSIFSVQYIVQKGSNFKGAISQSISLFKKHWITCIESSIILFIIKAAAVLLGAMLYQIIDIPLLALGIYLSEQAFATFAGILNVIILALLLFYVLFATAFITAYEKTYWAILFKDLSEENFVSKFKRFFLK